VLGVADVHAATGRIVVSRAAAQLALAVAAFKQSPESLLTAADARASSPSDRPPENFDLASRFITPVFPANRLPVHSLPLAESQSRPQRPPPANLLSVSDLNMNYSFVRIYGAVSQSNW
jgi:hypothetical protein